MKMLTFLSGSECENVLKTFIKHLDKNKGMISRLIALLSAKMQKNKDGSDKELEKLLIALSRQEVPVL